MVAGTGSTYEVKTDLSLPGLSGLGRERLSEIQRARLLKAMVSEVSLRGAGNVSVAHVVARAGVSRRTFYEIFKDRDDCFLASFDEAVERIAALVIPVYEQFGTWQESMRAALSAVLDLFEREPGTGRLVIVESLGAGPEALEHRARVLGQIATHIDLGRRESKGKPEPPPLTAEAVLGGVLSVLHARLAGKKKDGQLIELLHPLMGMIVLPYLGPVAARKETERRPIPKARPKARIAQSDPLRDLEMRLTYRTFRVLMAVAAHPGSSNRAIGHGAGVADQGQISKLLTRLQNLGLVENNGQVIARGEPNAWTLTTRGWEVYGAITEQANPA